MLRRDQIVALFSLAVAGVVLPTQAATISWINPAGGSFDVASNWSPASVPGAADTVLLSARPDLSGFFTIDVPTARTIAGITNSHFAQNIIDGAGTLSLASGQLAFTDSITESPGAALSSLFIRVRISAASGLTKTGPGFALLSNVTNNYTGGTTIGGPGGITITADAALGSLGSAITFDGSGGTLRTLPSPITLNRPVVLSTSTRPGKFEPFGNLTLGGVVLGPGNIERKRFTSGVLELSNTNTYTGTTRVLDGGSMVISGSSLNSTGVTLNGSLTLGKIAQAANNNRLGDSTSITSRGGTLRLVAGTAHTRETFGNFTINNGHTVIDLQTNASAGATMIAGGLTRNNRSTLFVAADDLGNGPEVVGRGRMIFADTAGLALVGGNGSGASNDSVIPFIAGNANPAGPTEAGLVTRTVDGLRVVSSSRYATSFAGSADDNVRVSDTTIAQTTGVTKNALVVRSTSASTSAGVSGAGGLTITSGQIVSVADSSADTLRISNPVNFASREAVIHTTPTSDGFSNLTMAGIISGTGGLTKAGNGSLSLNNTASTYSGQITVTGGTISFAGNVPATGTSSLGAGPAVVINAGANHGEFVGLFADTPDSTFSRAIQVVQSDEAGDTAIIGTDGGAGSTFAGTVTVEGGYLNLSGDADPNPMKITGQVTGAGGLQEPKIATPFVQTIRLTGNNNYQNGTIIRAGRWEVGSSTALGVGVVYFEGGVEPSTGAIAAFESQQSIDNPLVFRARPVFSGALALTLTGEVDLGSVTRDVLVSNTADTTMSGVVDAGGLNKLGAGRLILTGVNTFNGPVVVKVGTLRAGSNLALGTAVNQNIDQATAITGTARLELSGNITLPEFVLVGLSDQPVTFADPTGNLRVTSGNVVLSNNVRLDALGTIGVAAGSSLTVSGQLADSPAGTARLRKVDTGSLTVRNVRLTGLVIDAGTLTISPDGTATGASKINTLSIATGGTLALTNNNLVIDYAAASPQTAVRQHLLAGRIAPSFAGNPNRIGYGEASEIFATFPATFFGQSVDATSLLVGYTLAGDANLDRAVNFNDLVKLAVNYNNSGVWTGGDFNYDGLVNFEDLVLLAVNYNLSVVNAVPTRVGSANDFANDWARALALVPEPASASVAATLLLLLCRKHRPTN